MTIKKHKADVGWGGLADCFDEKHSKYGELKSLLTDEEYTAARESTLTAFYTPPVVIRSIYKALGNMGFSQGNILDPAAGVGNFEGTDEINRETVEDLIKAIYVYPDKRIEIEWNIAETGY